MEELFVLSQSYIQRSHQVFGKHKSILSVVEYICHPVSSIAQADDPLIQWNLRKASGLCGRRASKRYERRAIYDPPMHARILINGLQISIQHIAVLPIIVHFREAACRIANFHTHRSQWNLANSRSAGSGRRAERNVLPAIRNAHCGVRSLEIRLQHISIGSVV